MLIPRLFFRALSARRALVSSLVLLAVPLAVASETWSPRVSGTAYQLQGVTYGNGLFVAVGVSPHPGSGTILTSPDGVSWTPRDSGTDEDVVAVTYGNGLFLAVTSGDFLEGGSVLTSSDGLVWTRSADVVAYLNAVTYGNGLFVIVGIGGTILTSPDGVSWTDRTQDTHAAPFHGVLFANGQFVAVGGSDSADSLIYTSPDGATWQSRTSPVEDRLYAVAYGNGVYVVTGEYDSHTGQPVILTSPDAVTWTSRPLFLTSSALRGLAYGNGQFVAVGGVDLPNNSSLLVTSPDGVTWTREDSSVQSALLSAVNAGGTFVAVGRLGTIIQSSGTAAQTQAAALTAPPPTAPLPGDTATFTWDAGSGLGFYWLSVGSSPGGTNLFSSGAWGTALSQTVSGLPQDGQPVYVRLYSGRGDTVLYRDYGYTASKADSTVPATIPLAQALDAPTLAWTTGGAAPWFGQTNTTHDAVSALQSGTVVDGQESWLQTTVAGPGTLSFWWKINSAPNVNYLNFDVDGALQSFISGSADWAQQTVSLTNGTHSIRWVFSEDVGAGGPDLGWVDQVQWTPGSGASSPPRLTSRIASGKLTLSWPSTGESYVPEYTDSLVSPHWSPVLETSSAAAGEVAVSLALAEPMRFFRLRHP